MPKTKEAKDEVPLDWMKKEQTRSKEQGAGDGNHVNPAVPQPKEKTLKVEVKTANDKMPFLDRIQKGFHPTKDRAGKFDVLVAKQKHVSGKKGPDLIDEALDLLFEKYPD